jgi:hypothetical protein
MAIEAAHYREAREKLMSDPIIRDMVVGLANEPLDRLQHADSETPRFEFMQAANREYESRGGTIKAHIGAVAEALLILLKNLSTKEAPMVTITFELTVTIKETGDKVFFETSVDVPKENLEDALSALRAMPHVRNIQY